MARLQRIAAIATIALSSCGPHVAGPRAGASGLQSNACNDGNALNGDGCSAAHEVEPGWSCTSGPSACVATHPSCAGLPDTCAGTSCCASHVVPGGNFVLGKRWPEKKWVPDGTPCLDCNGEVEQPSFSANATLAAFALDDYVVTVGRYRRFVAAYEHPPQEGAGAHPLIADSGWQASAWDKLMPADGKGLASALLQCDPGLGPPLQPKDHMSWTDQPGPNEQLPINCVTWYEAFAFCAWDGGRLPTEAEWEYAARGGALERKFPWGDELTGVASAQSSRIDHLVPVGSDPDEVGFFGQFDLVSESWQWVLDAEAPRYIDPCLNCAAVRPAPVCVAGDPIGAAPKYCELLAGARIVRGFPYTNTRLGYLPLWRNSKVGFRCARSVVAR